MATSKQLHFTIYFDGENFKLLNGPPTKFNLAATVSHRFMMGEKDAIWWTVNCELIDHEVRRMAKRLLKKL
jgi:hypothetical protein